MHCNVYTSLDLRENDTRLSKLFIQHLCLKNKDKSLLHTLRKQVDITSANSTYFGHLRTRNRVLPPTQQSSTKEGSYYV